MIEFLTTDRYAAYVAASFLGTTLILVWLVVASLQASRRAVRDLEAAESERAR